MPGVSSFKASVLLGHFPAAEPAPVSSNSSDQLSCSHCLLLQCPLDMPSGPGPQTHTLLHPHPLLPSPLNTALLPLSSARQSPTHVQVPSTQRFPCWTILPDLCLLLELVPAFCCSPSFSLVFLACFLGCWTVSRYSLNCQCSLGKGERMRENVDIFPTPSTPEEKNKDNCTLNDFYQCFRKCSFSRIAN